APAKVEGKINFSKVHFAYVRDRYVLKDISFNLEAGQTMAIVGHTGSGKTSIISLINRLYKINSGSIRVDGVNIEDYELSVLRKNIAVVLQDVFLFSGTIMDNVTLHNEKISRAQVESAA